MKLPIDKNIPLPPKGSAKRDESPYPFDDMDVGDSFFVFGDRTKRHSVVTLANNQQTKRGQSGKKFAARDTAPDGFRVWRIA